MQIWQRFTAIAIGVAALHGAALWAVHSYRAQTDAADMPSVMVTRSMQMLTDVEPIANNIRLAPPLPAVSPKSAATRATKNKSIDEPTLPAVASQVPRSAPTTRIGLPLATNSLKPAATTDTTSQTATPKSSDTEFSSPPSANIAAAIPSVSSVSNTPQKTAGIAAEGIDLVRPEYTKMMKRFDQTGRVQIAFEVDTDGHTVNARVLQSSGYSTLDTAALDAARKTRYKPATCGGKKVQSNYTRNYAFGVDPSPDPPQPFIDCSAS